MPARDNRFSQVGTNSGGDRMYARTYAGASVRGSDYASMTKPELEELLVARDLPKSGTKDELIARLQESD